MKRLLRFLFVVPALLIALLPVGGQAASSPGCPTPIFLRMNAYYVPYMYPGRPYLSCAGEVMAPLRGLLLIVGGRFTSASTGSFAWSVGGTTLSFRAGDRRARLDSAPLTLRAAPVIHSATGSLFIPLRAIGDAFGIRYSWDPRTRVFAMTHPRLMDPGRLEEVAEFEDALANTTRSGPDTTELLPRSLSLVGFVERYPDVQISKYRMTVGLEDVSRSGIPPQRVRLYTLVFASPRGVIYKGGAAIFFTIDFTAKDPCHQVARRQYRCVEEFQGQGDVPHSAFNHGLQMVVLRVQIGRR